MSWHRSYSNRAQFTADSPQFQSGDVSAQQLHEARAAAEAIIESGAVAAPDADVMVNLSGHERDAVHGGQRNIAVTVTEIG